jgi:GT2 family glycosyltransferase
MATTSASKPGIWAVVVTFNRKELLQKCLESITGQSCGPDRILVVNNASTDGTTGMLNEHGWLERGIELLTLTKNAGGAGGFAAGIREAIEDGADWIWMMDDDAEPHPTALAELMKVANNPRNVYGSLATKGTDTSWTTTLLDPNQHVVDNVADVPDSARVQSLPFLGFMIHRELVQEIGLPDAGYFIAADDIEYCLRAERAGAQLIIAGQSRIEHPKSDRYEANRPGRRLICLRLPPWKRYYDTRNRMLIARKYYGVRMLTQTIPGSFVRLYAALRYEPRKLAQLWAFCAGMFDGLLGFKGRRHAKWGIHQ